MPDSPLEEASPRRPLLATVDPALRAETARLAAAAGCPIEQCSDPADLHRQWRSSRSVLLGAELLADLHARALPPRAGVHVLCPDPPDVEALRAAVDLRVESVLELPTDASRVAALLGDLGEDGEVREGRVVGVVGASGGVGASVLTVALSEVASRHGAALAVDLDERGAGLEVLVGSSGPPAVGWPSLDLAQGRLSGTALRTAVATAGGPGVLGWGVSGSRVTPSATLVREALAAARRGHEWVFVDSRSPEVWSSCDALVVVVAGSVPGLAAAVRTGQRLPRGLRAGIAVRSAREDRMAHQVARSLGRPLWSVLTRQRALDEHLSAGLGPVRGRRSPLTRAANDILTELAAP